MVKHGCRWVQMGWHGWVWMNKQRWGEKNKGERSKIGDQDMDLYCVVMARKNRKLAGMVSVVKEDYGEEWRGNKRFAVQCECV